MENLNDVKEGAYLALPMDMMISLLNTMDLCVQALTMMDPQNKEQMEIQQDALAAAFALINAHSELH